MNESYIDSHIACQDYVEVGKYNLNRETPLGTRITVILGNISCDLDSAVSSLVYAFFLFWKKAQWRSVEEHKEKPIVYIPVLNIPRIDYLLKTEVTHLFNQISIDPDKLVFRDEIDLEVLHSGGQVNLILVDHHIMSECDKSLASSVVQILDHRPKDDSNWPYEDSVDATIEMVGSCATLVCEKILADTFYGMRFLKMTDVATLLYCHSNHATGFDTAFTNNLTNEEAAIILDTVNFSPTACRGTPKDMSMVEELEKIMGIQDVVSNRATTLNTLQAAKSNISHLTAEQLLRKDAKTVGPIFLPGFPLLVEEYLKKESVKVTLEKVVESESVKVILLLGVKINGANIERDLAVYSGRRYKKMALKVAEALKNSKTTDLQLSKKICNLKGCALYEQNNLKATRKHIIPIIEEFLK